MVDADLYEYLQKYVEYSPLDGALRWKAKPWRSSIVVGKVTGSSDRDGYRRTMINKKIYRNARLVWFMHYGKWPENLIDHVNGVRDDDRIENLRDATSQENSQNRRIKKNHATGYKGVSFHKRDKRFQATLEVNKKVKFLGYFDSAKEAHQAYCVASKNVFGEFANFGNATSR
jgi:hypothetical protein